MSCSYGTILNIAKLDSNNIIVEGEKDYISRRGKEYDEVSMVGFPCDDLIHYFVFDSATDEFIETAYKRVGTDLVRFKKMLDDSDSTYEEEVSSAIIDDENINTNDVIIQNVGSNAKVKFLFESSAQDLIGVVTEIDKKPKAPLIHFKGCTCGCQS